MIPTQEEIDQAKEEIRAMAAPSFHHYFEPWRIDANGHQWYRPRRRIHGEISDEYVHEVDDDEDDEQPVAADDELLDVMMNRLIALENRVAALEETVTAPPDDVEDDDA